MSTKYRRWRKCPRCADPLPPKVVTVEKRCMAPLSEDDQELIDTYRFPPPDDPDNPKSPLTLSVENGGHLGALIGALVDYIEIEYARCGQKTTP